MGVETRKRPTITPSQAALDHVKIQLPTIAPLIAPGRYQRTTGHSISLHETKIRVGLAIRLAIVITGAIVFTRMKLVTAASKTMLPAPPEKVLIVQLTHPATNSRMDVSRSGTQQCVPRAIGTPACRLTSFQSRAKQYPTAPPSAPVNPIRTMLLPISYGSTTQADLSRHSP